MYDFAFIGRARAHVDLLEERIAELEEGLCRIRGYLDMPIRRSLNTALINTIDALLAAREEESDG